MALSLMRFLRSILPWWTRFWAESKILRPWIRHPERQTRFPLTRVFRAIMFTDLKDSTLMTTLYGDSKALHLLHIHNPLTRNSLKVHRGREVKHTGDGIMASFDSVPDAVGCAVAIQKAFAAYNKENPEAPLYLRIGLSAGEPIEEHGDLFGKAVQLAARLCGHAEPGPDSS
jgi:class 3 adenylate cyclase